MFLLSLSHIYSRFHAGGCHINNHPSSNGRGDDVLVRSLDEIVEELGGSNLLQDNRVVRLLKIDVEGGETKIMEGMNQLLASGKVLNLIIELTPAHWNQAGLPKYDRTAARHFAKIMTAHHYDGYLLYTQQQRHPPAHLSHIVSRVTKEHPINGYLKENGVNVTQYGIQGNLVDTGCEKSPFWKIHDLEHFILTYCVEWMATAWPPSKGSCGNLWFTKRSSWLQQPASESKQRTSPTPASTHSAASVSPSETKPYANPIHLPCSSIQTNPVVYQATYTVFRNLSIPCVLFGGSAIGVVRHHGIIPRGEKDIDIACWSSNWKRDRHILEKKLTEINPNWKYSLQGYNVPIQGSKFFLDVWLHGPDPYIASNPASLVLDQPTRCVGFDRTDFESFPMQRMLPELVLLLIQKPNKKLQRKKHEWLKMKDPHTCFMFYSMFGPGYVSSHFQSKEIQNKRSPIWPAGMFWNRERSVVAMGLFGTSLVPVPFEMNKYVEQRYGNVMEECGQHITGNYASCHSQLWERTGMVHVTRTGTNHTTLGRQQTESLVIPHKVAPNLNQKEPIKQEKWVQHVIYKCFPSGQYSCDSCEL